MPAVNASKYLTNAGWDDVPHLDADTKSKLLANTQPYLRDARSKGIPSLGSGAIYPVEQDVFLVDPFAIPAHWRKVYALDVGWNRTAGIWGAYDGDQDTIYLYSEHYRGQAEPSIHATAIKARGPWIPGVIDPAARGRSQKDGERLYQLYLNQGLNLYLANNAVDAGIQEVWERLSTGRLKVFSSLRNWLGEHRLYRRDEKGAIVKKNDHLMDATRYLVMSGLRYATTKPIPKFPSNDTVIADRVGGY